MRLGELSNVACWLPAHPTATDPIWQRNPLAISEGEIQLYYARSGLAGLRQDAIEAMDAVQAAVIISAFSGELPEPPLALVQHELPDEPYFVDELVSSLARMRPSRRGATLFCLETGEDPDFATTVNWKEIKPYLTQATPLVGEVIVTAAKARHFKLPYVFWEWATPQIATPLLELQWNIEQAFDCRWPALLRRYRNIVKINRHADGASLLELANQG